MKRFMLDTNAVSDLIKNHPLVRERVMSVPMSSLCISSITEAELLFGLTKRPEATRLRQAVEEFLLRVEVLAWDSNAASEYAIARANQESIGKPISTMDLLIASHAISQNLTLVSRDQVFRQFESLEVANWAEPKIQK
jgi:tRNA(fMet)-specific endonuclease VapC